VQGKKGVTYSITLDEYKELVNNQPDSMISQVFGLLETTITHDEYAGSLSLKEYKVEAADKKSKGKDEAKENSLFFRFELEAGTDLSEHGMALVYDNLGDKDHHCTLVRESTLGKKTRTWHPLIGVHNHVYAPQQFDSLDKLKAKDLEDMLSLSNCQEQPETIFDAVIAGQSYSIMFSHALLRNSDFFH